MSREPVLDCDAPGGGDLLLPWLEARKYDAWSAEAKAHESSGPHGRVRVFVNDVLEVSVADDNQTHPRCAMAIQEIYDDGSHALHGWTVSLKLAEESADGRNWYWYEHVDETTVVDGAGAHTCVECHADGVDYYLSNFPR